MTKTCSGKKILWYTQTPSCLLLEGVTGLVSSGVSLTPWGEGVSSALVGHPSSGGITIKIPYGVDVLLHQPASQLVVAVISIDTYPFWVF